jgi:uncharacterized membrane protein YdjX (TVP38/TMEM64 family)
VSPSKKAKTTKSRKKTTAKKNVAVVDSRPAVQNQGNWLINALRPLALLAVIGITVYIYSIRDRVDEFAAYGYPGIFMVMLLANATVIIPAPGLAIVFAMGSVFPPLGVAIAGGTGGAVGELSGYLAGFSGQAIVENTKLYDRILPWIQKYGAWAILALSAFPNPFFDIAGIAAGVTRIPIWKFLLFCWVGQVIKATIFAYAGLYSIDWLAKLF